MKSEATVMQQVRLEASGRGARLFRNNNGAAVDKDGRHIRYGLGNESKQINQVIKSSDLIGITPLVITPDMVGKTIGVFTAIEVKRSSWKYTGTDREKAQKAFIDIIKNLGGFAQFAADQGDLII